MLNGTKEPILPLCKVQRISLTGGMFMEYEEIGKRIKKQRQFHNMTREKLAEKAQISSKFLYEIELGKKGLSAETLLKLSRTLSCSCDYIMTGKSDLDVSDEKIIILWEKLNDTQKEHVLAILSLIQEMYANEKGDGN